MVGFPEPPEPPDPDGLVDWLKSLPSYDHEWAVQQVGSEAALLALYEMILQAEYEMNLAEYHVELAEYEASRAQAFAEYEAALAAYEVALAEYEVYKAQVREDFEGALDWYLEAKAGYETGQCCWISLREDSEIASRNHVLSMLQETAYRVDVWGGCRIPGVYCSRPFVTAGCSVFSFNRT